MTKFFAYLAFFSFSLFSLSAPLLAEETKINPKVAMIKEALDIYIGSIKPNEDDFLKIFEAEFKALGFEQMPFAKTIKKAMQDELQNDKKAFQELYSPMLIDYYIAHFSDAEIKELVAVFKNPLFQKHAKFLQFGWFPSTLDVLKDPKIFQKYETIITQVIDWAKDPNTANKFKEIVPIAMQEFQTLAGVISSNVDSLKEKFKVQFPPLAPFVLPLLDNLKMKAAVDQKPA